MAKRRGNQEGSIYRRKSGRWVAQVSLEGKRITKNFSTQAECRTWIKEMTEQIENGLSLSGAKVTMEEYLLAWLEGAKDRLRPKTWYQYSGILRNHIIPRIGRVKLKDLQPVQIQQLYSQLRQSGMSQRSTQIIHNVLHRALVVAQRQGLIGRNPAQAVDPPKVPHNEMQVLDDNQARSLLIAVQGTRNKALYHLAITTGVRQGEILGLKWRDLDWASGTLQIRRQLQRVVGEGLVFSEPKTNAGRRIIELGREALKQLVAHRKRQDLERQVVGWIENDLIFPSEIGTPMDQKYLHREFKSFLQQAGLPDIRFHDLRHTAATLMLIHGIPLIIVSRRLGHSKPSVTLDIYGHYLPGMQSEAAALMDELVTPIAAQLQQNEKQLLK